MTTPDNGQASRTAINRVRFGGLLGVPVAYKTIVADPPWAETGGGKIKRGADKHYSVIKDKDMAAVLLAAPCWRPAADCHLWLWVTNNRLPIGLEIMAALGFRYVTNLVWVKDRIGIGQYLRGQHELCLFGVRGQTMMPPRRDVPSVLHAPRTVHSRKPAKAFEVFERVSSGTPRLEMFARTERHGWDVWGNEIGGENKSSSFFDRVNIGENEASGEKPQSEPAQNLNETVSSAARNSDSDQCLQGLNLENLKSEKCQLVK